MSNKLSAIAVDFGSTNSGCARVYEKDTDGNLVFSQPDYLHALPNYVKDNTCFYVSPLFLQRMRHDYENIKDDDFRIESRLLHDDNPNVMWMRDTINNHSEQLASEQWTCFRQFKMLLYKGGETMLEGCTLVNVIKTFLRILKIECLRIEQARVGRKVDAKEIEWGLTIPSIWTDENKKIMADIAHSVFSPVARVLSEPEGPLVSNLLYSCGNSNVPYEDRRTSLVVDIGGGTTDICLMKEVKQDNGTYKFEMLDYTDGTNAGGNDIDHDFWVYLLRKISDGATSDTGVMYDSLSDNELVDMLWGKFKTNVKACMELEDNWLKLKEKDDLASKQAYGFVFTKDYRLWLKNSGHKALALDMVNYLLEGFELSGDELRKRVLKPTFDRICKKVEDIIVANKDKCGIDKVVLAGGMSLNNILVSCIKATVDRVLGGQNDVLTTPGLQAGAAILWGACYLLITGDFVVRKATRNYYYDVAMRRSEAINILVDEYKKLGVKVPIGILSDMENSERQKGFALMKSQDSQVVLDPIAVKGQPIVNYSDKISVGESQKNMIMALYSTDGTKVYYANPANPDLKHEGTIKAECMSSRDYIVEADLNEAQISNAIRCQIRDAKTGQIVGEPFVIEDK